MKKKEIQSLHQASVKELTKTLSETEKRLAQVVKDRYTKQSKNVREGKALRTQIARIKTIIQEKNI